MGGFFAAVTVRGVEAAPLIVEALKRQLFLGDDCAGIAVLGRDGLVIRKDSGSVEEVDSRLGLSRISGRMGLGHTRFSTHGRPHRENAHPHIDCKGKIAVVGDGAIANYEELRDRLMIEGHRIISRCDFEIVPHILEKIRVEKSFAQALANAASMLDGFYTIAALDAEAEALGIYSSTKPFYIGLGRQGVFASATRASLHGYAERVAEVPRGVAVILTGPKRVEAYRVPGLEPVDLSFEPLRIDPATIEKDGYPHHMLREIYEIPYALLRTLSTIQKKYLMFAAKLVREARRIYVVADGTSLHAGYVGNYYLADLTGLSSLAVSAAEFPLYHVSNVGPGDIVVAISQSGETGDVVNSVYEAKLRGATILGITNHIGSRLARLSNLFLPMGAGPELAVPATKTFTSSLLVLYLVALAAAEESGRLRPSEARERVAEIKSFSHTMLSRMSGIDRRAAEAAGHIAGCRSGYVVSRGISYPIAMEGALKLKEAAYVHAEGMEAGEFKHGPIVLVEKGFFTVFVIPVERQAAAATYPLISSALEKEATVAVVGFEDDPRLEELSGEALVVRVPRTNRHLAPIALTIPLQYLAYRLGVAKGLDVDRPRYLSKAVTAPG